MTTTTTAGPARPARPADLLRLGEVDLDTLFYDARSSHPLAADPVPDGVIEAVHDLVRWGPTAINSSPMRLLLVRSAEARSRLAAQMAEGNRDRVLTAPLSIVVAADTDFHEHLDVLGPHRPGTRERLAATPETRVRMARDNTWLQAGYLVVGLRAAGLAVGPMSGMDAAGIDADLLAGTSWRSILVLNVGRPATDGQPYPRAPRLDVTQTTLVV
ncbi:MAG TPA: malonic semialdehyde reductase [Actinotalea sp.]|nr:malonic semialdehyde reductase [Actinotalea sp.]